MATAKAQGASALRDLAASTLSVEAILELIERLGMKDLLINKIRARLENADIDDLIDDGIDYVRRNPEVLVVILGAITVTAGLIVFLESRHPRDLDEDDSDEMPQIARPRPAARKPAAPRRRASGR
jgi:hypothetical protein